MRTVIFCSLIPSSLRIFGMHTRRLKTESKDKTTTMTTMMMAITCRDDDDDKNESYKATVKMDRKRSTRKPFFCKDKRKETAGSFFLRFFCE